MCWYLALIFSCQPNVSLSSFLTFFSQWGGSLLSLEWWLLCRIANCCWQFDPFHYALTTTHAVFTKIKTWELTNFSHGKTSIERIRSHELIGNFKMEKSRKIWCEYSEFNTFPVKACISPGGEHFDETPTANESNMIWCHPRIQIYCVHWSKKQNFSAVNFSVFLHGCAFLRK